MSGRGTVTAVLVLAVAACAPSDGTGAGGAEPSPPATTAPTDGAGASGPPAAPPPAPAPAPGILSNGGTYYVTYALRPDPIPLNELFSIDLVVYDANDRAGPLRDVELAVDGRMPEHRHGMNREPRIERREDGGFTVTGMLFHMPGFWELHFDVTREGMTERAQVATTLD